MASDQQASRAAPRRPWWRRLWATAAGHRRRRRVAHALYGSVVDQARRPRFYRDWGVPDTPEGRFEVIGLHAFFVLRRLRALGEPGRALGQAVFDVMFADLDRSLRELGVGDLSVGKHVKRYARFFYGRVAGLEEAFAAGGPAPVADVLRRNLYAGGRPPEAGALADFAAYVIAQDRHLAAQAADDLLAGRVTFLPPTTGGGAAAEDLEPARRSPI